MGGEKQTDLGPVVVAGFAKKRLERRADGAFSGLGDRIMEVRPAQGWMQRGQLSKCGDVVRVELPGGARVNDHGNEKGGWLRRRWRRVAGGSAQ